MFSLTMLVVAFFTRRASPRQEQIAFAGAIAIDIAFLLAVSWSMFRSR